MFKKKPYKINKEIIVYWSPWWNIEKKNSFDIYYHEPENVYTNLLDKYEQPRITKNFMHCPAFRDAVKNSYVIFSQTDIDLSIQTNENNEIQNFGFTHPEKIAIGGKLSHMPSLKNQFLIETDMAVTFFSEQSLDISITSPFFHETPYLSSAAVVPGKFNIGKWFRPINFEFNLWENVKRLKIDSGEPILYFNFYTDSKIVFKRFQFNERLFYLSSQLVRYRQNPDKPMSLMTRYKKFEQSMIKNVILKEIKNNLL